MKPPGGPAPYPYRVSSSEVDGASSRHEEAAARSQAPTELPDAFLEQYKRTGGIEYSPVRQANSPVRQANSLRVDPAGTRYNTNATFQPPTIEPHLRKMLQQQHQNIMNWHENQFAAASLHHPLRPPRPKEGESTPEIPSRRPYTATAAAATLPPPPYDGQWTPYSAPPIHGPYHHIPQQVQQPAPNSIPPPRHMQRQQQQPAPNLIPVQQRQHQQNQPSLKPILPQQHIQKQQQQHQKNQSSPNRIPPRRRIQQQLQQQQQPVQNSIPPHHNIQHQQQPAPNAIPPQHLTQQQQVQQQQAGPNRILPHQRIPPSAFSLKVAATYNRMQPPPPPTGTEMFIPESAPNNNSATTTKDNNNKVRQSVNQAPTDSYEQLLQQQRKNLASLKNPPMGLFPIAPTPPAAATKAHVTKQHQQHSKLKLAVNSNTPAMLEARKHIVATAAPVAPGTTGAIPYTLLKKNRRPKPQRARKDDSPPWTAVDYRTRKTLYNQTVVTAEEIQKAIPKDASCIFHLLDRRINLDTFLSADEENVSFYALLRAWVQDDPYRYVPPVGSNLLDYVSLPSERRQRPVEEDTVTNAATTGKGAADDQSMTDRWKDDAKKPTIDILRKLKANAQNERARPNPRDLLVANFIVPSKRKRERTKKYRLQKEAAAKRLRSMGIEITIK